MLCYIQSLNNGIYTAYEYFRPPLSVTPIRVLSVNKILFKKWTNDCLLLLPLFVMKFCTFPLLCCAVLRVSSSFAIMAEEETVG